MGIYYSLQQACWPLCWPEQGGDVNIFTLGTQRVKQSMFTRFIKAQVAMGAVGGGVVMQGWRRRKGRRVAAQTRERLCMWVAP
jgi:hypothetical protein